jgi:outer membrane protein OmpA-like peptidoglycan-associated protein
VEELDERDVARGRMDRSVEERMYVLVQSRMSELELQLAMELGIFERSGLWERIMAAAGWDLPVDPGIGNAMEALEIPLSRETQRILSAEDDSFWPVVKERTEVAPTWVGQLAAMLGGANGVHSVSNSSLPLEELHLPESFDVPFAAGSAVLDLNARMQLAEVRDLMGRYPELRVVCTGHADANGPRRSNEELSKVRAEAVRAMLLESGVDPARVLMNYFGEERAGWVPEDDRRVEVRFHWDAR